MAASQRRGFRQADEGVPLHRGRHHQAGRGKKLTHSGRADRQGRAGQKRSATASRAAVSYRLTSLPRPESAARSEEHTSELQSLMRISYAVFCLKKKNK